MRLAALAQPAPRERSGTALVSCGVRGVLRTRASGVPRSIPASVWKIGGLAARELLRRSECDERLGNYDASVVLLSVFEHGQEHASDRGGAVERVHGLR